MTAPQPPGAPALCLVVPVYGGLSAFSRYLPELAAALRAAELPVVLKVVDDGNGPGATFVFQQTLTRARAFVPCDLVTKPLNEGKGSAVYGVWYSHTRALWLGFVDADGSVPAPEVVRVCQAALAAAPSCSAVAAVRSVASGKRVRRYPHRRLLGRVLALCAKTLLGIRISDTQCGLKLVRGNVFAGLIPVLCERRFSFDLELLAALNQRRERVEPLPVDWAESGESSIVLLRDIPAIGLGLLRVSWRRWRGRLS